MKQPDCRSGDLFEILFDRHRVAADRAGRVARQIDRHFNVEDELADVTRMNYGHVGTLNAIIHRLDEILEMMESMDPAPKTDA